MLNHDEVASSSGHSEIAGAPSPLLRVALPLPVVTRALVGINLAVFLAMVLTGVSPVNPNIPQLLKWGAN